MGIGAQGRLRESFDFRFLDLSRDDEAVCVVREGPGVIALDLGLRRGGELSVTLDPDAACALAGALLAAAAHARA